MKVTAQRNFQISVMYHSGSVAGCRSWKYQ